jgi:hypothetical protein
VFQEDQFQSLIVALSRFPIVRRVQIKEGHRFGLAPDIHRVGLQSLDSQGSRLFCPIGVDLNAIPVSGYAMQQVGERRAIANTGIKRRESLREDQPIPQSLGLGYRKGEKA